MSGCNWPRASIFTPELTSRICHAPADRTTSIEANRTPTAVAALMFWLCEEIIQMPPPTSPVYVVDWPSHFSGGAAATCIGAVGQNYPISGAACTPKIPSNAPKFSNVITTYRLLEAGHSGLFAKAAKVTYDLSLDTSAGKHTVRNIDDQVPGLKELHDLLFSYQAAERYKEIPGFK